MQHLDDGRLQEWVDRARSGLGAEEQEAIQRHLAACSDCAGRVASLTELDGQTRSLLSSGMPTDEIPDFAAVRGRANGLATQRRRRGMMQGGAWAASLVIALGVGWVANEMARGGALTNGVPVSRSTAQQAETQVGPTASPSADLSGEAPRVAAVTEAVPDAEPANRGQPQAIVAQEPGVMTAATPTRSTLPAASTEVIELDVAVPTPTQARLPAAATAETAAVEVMPITPAGPRVVRGRVTDESGVPVEAAQVYFEGSRIGALTSTDGTFRLLIGELESVGQEQPLTLMVQQVGYRQESRDLTVGGGETVLGDVRLSQQALSLDEVVVTGAAPQRRTLAGRAAGERAENAAEAEDAAESVTVGVANWVSLLRTEAEAVAGFAIMSLPDRPIEEVSVESFEGVRVSRVLQTLEGGATVTLLQSRRAIRVSDELTEDEGLTASTTRDGFFVVALGRLPRESLEAVLEQVR